MTEAETLIEQLVERARRAQQSYSKYSQQQIDEVVVAAAWAIMEPSRNRELAELAVRDTGLGDVDDKIRKNYRKTLGLLRDLEGAVTVGVISENRQTGITEIARPVGVVAAITPSTNPGATPANKILNALEMRQRHYSRALAEGAQHGAAPVADDSSANAQDRYEPGSCRSAGAGHSRAG